MNYRIILILSMCFCYCTWGSAPVRRAPSEGSLSFDARPLSPARSGIASDFRPRAAVLAETEFVKAELGQLTIQDRSEAFIVSVQGYTNRGDAYEANQRLVMKITANQVETPARKSEGRPIASTIKIPTASFTTGQAPKDIISVKITSEGKKGPNGKRNVENLAKLNADKVKQILFYVPNGASPTDVEHLIQAVADLVTKSAVTKKPLIMKLENVFAKKSESEDDIDNLLGTLMTLIRGTEALKEAQEVAGRVVGLSTKWLDTSFAKPRTERYTELTTEIQTIIDAPNLDKSSLKPDQQSDRVLILYMLYKLETVADEDQKTLWTRALKTLTGWTAQELDNDYRNRVLLQAWPGFDNKGVVGIMYKHVPLQGNKSKEVATVTTADKIKLYYEFIKLIEKLTDNVDLSSLFSMSLYKRTDITVKDTKTTIFSLFSQLYAEAGEAPWLNQLLLPIVNKFGIVPSAGTTPTDFAQFKAALGSFATATDEPTFRRLAEGGSNYNQLLQYLKDNQPTS